MKKEKVNSSRRNFLKTAGSSTVAGLAIGTAGVPAIMSATATDVAAQGRRKTALGSSRADLAYQFRVDAAQSQFDETTTDHPVNGDETTYANYIGNYSKALPHNTFGEVDLSAYNAMLAAVTSGVTGDYDLIPLGGTAKLANPQAANAFQVEGCDSHSLPMPAPPALASYTEAGEMLEVYWQALVRDIAFDDYAEDATIATAFRELRKFPQFRTISTTTIFRGETSGDHIGPYISQFLLKPIPYGATTVEQKYRVPVAGDDKMTGYSEWHNVQNGGTPFESPVIDPTTRYIRNGRDLGEFVHQDSPFQSYFSAASILLSWGSGAISDSNPYNSISNQGGFVQFGAAHIYDMVSRVANASLKAAWYQKWNVHRRLRPEAFAGIIHNQLNLATSYPLKIFIGGSKALQTINSQNGSYLLPMAYPEGSPTHPAYPAGHAAIAGACVTMLKAFFKEDFEVPSPVVVDNDGESLAPYTGSQLKLGNELNKLAANISLGRDMAGVHWRSDGIEGIRLGENVAIQMLRDYRNSYNETFGGFSFTKFDGSSVTV